MGYPREGWARQAKPSMRPAAREQVEKILDGPVVDAPLDDIGGQLDGILRRADVDLMED